MEKMLENPDNLYFYIQILCPAIHALTICDFGKYGVKFSGGFSNFLTHAFHLDTSCGIHHDNFLFYHQHTWLPCSNVLMPVAGEKCTCWIHKRLYTYVLISVFPSVRHFQGEILSLDILWLYKMF